VQQPAAQLTLDYPVLLEALKSRIRAAQVKAALAVNRELVLLYWELGQRILESQKREGWGAKVIDRLVADLRYSFPEMTGLSRRNLQCMRSFAEEFPDAQIVQQLVAQIPWGHILQIQQKLKDLAEREYTLQGQQKPIGVASYRTMPAHLRGTLPSPGEIEAGLVAVDAVN
jgi:predicted nuclease of restriction endonuclease-like (RecB) superfamily